MPGGRPGEAPTCPENDGAGGPPSMMPPAAAAAAGPCARRCLAAWSAIVIPAVCSLSKLGIGGGCPPATGTLYFGSTPRLWAMLSAYARACGDCTDGCTKG